MKFRYRNVVLGVATGMAAAMCLSTAAYAGGPGEEEMMEESPAPPPAVVEVMEEPEEDTLGSWIPGTFSGEVTLISDYSFRGISQTQTGFAAQGGATWTLDCGFYLGTWASSVNFSGAPSDDSFLEQDFIAGFSKEFGDFTLDTSAIWLWYPKESDLNYWEFAVNGSYNVADIATISAGVMYAPNYFAYADNAGYFSTGVAFPLPVEVVALTLDANVGYTITDEPLLGVDEDDYVDWNVGLNVGLHENVSVDLRYVDTDAEDFLGNIAGARFIGGVTFSF